MKGIFVYKLLISTGCELRGQVFVIKTIESFETALEAETRLNSIQEYHNSEQQQKHEFIHRESTLLSWEIINE